MKIGYKMYWPAALLAAGVFVAPAAFGNAVRFDFGPTGTPSMTALFQDVGPNQVQLTISALALSSRTSHGTPPKARNALSIPSNQLSCFSWP